jgi:hypothetical protein
MPRKRTYRNVNILKQYNSKMPLVINSELVEFILQCEKGDFEEEDSCIICFSSGEKLLVNGLLTDVIDILNGVKNIPEKTDKT